MLDSLKIIIVCLTVCVMVNVTTGFLFQSKCVVSPPCVCYLNSFQCQRRNLTELPTFTEHTEHYSRLVISLYENELTTIPANAFKNLSSISATGIIINLYYNSLSHIDLHAFDGIATAVKILNLSFNNLTYLPSALAKLTSLRNLYLGGNPLTRLDSAVMSQFGQTVRVFTVSVVEFNIFPNELTLLDKLSYLIVSIGYHNTSLSQIQPVIVGLPNLNFFEIVGSTFDCSCSEMESLKTWNVTSIHIEAKCNSGESVETYLMSVLPKCS